MTQYRFLTVWDVEAPIERVFEALLHSERWPDWWRGVARVEQLQTGDASGLGDVRRYTFRSRLPYALTFDMCSTLVDPPWRLSGDASGDLRGVGGSDDRGGPGPHLGGQGRHDAEDGGAGVRFPVTADGGDRTGFVVRFGDAAHAYLNRCAHVPMELDWQAGVFFSADRATLLCSTHGAAYAPDDGRCLGGPCDGKSLVELGVEEQGAHPAEEPRDQHRAGH